MSEDLKDLQARTYQDWDVSGSKTQLLLEVGLFRRSQERRRDPNDSASETAPFHLTSLTLVALWKGSIFSDFPSAFFLAWTSLALPNFFKSFFYIESHCWSLIVGGRRRSIATLYKCERGYRESPVEWERTHTQYVALFTASECESERAYRGVEEKKTEDLLFDSCPRGGRTCCHQMTAK